MAETANIRLERITKLLHELRYEVERGMVEHEIKERIAFRFVVPVSQEFPGGVVLCEFSTRPVNHRDAFMWPMSSVGVAGL